MENWKRVLLDRSGKYSRYIINHVVLFVLRHNGNAFHKRRQYTSLSQSITVLSRSRRPNKEGNTDSIFRRICTVDHSIIE